MLQNELIQFQQKDLFTTSKLLADKLQVPHPKVIRTIERIIKTWDYENDYKEIILKHWKTKLPYEAYDIKQSIIDNLFIRFNWSSFPKSSIRKWQRDNTNLYIIQWWDYFKIWITKNIELRFARLRWWCPFKLEIFMTWKNASINDEIFLHKHFENKRMEWEWFKLDIEDLDFIKHYFYNELKQLPNIPESYPSLLLDLSIMEWCNINDYEIEKELIPDWISYHKQIRMKWIIKNAIIDWMSRKLPYKEIYLLAKQELETFAKILPKFDNLKIN